ncbi:MAG: CDP-alcohol phosphatidyltransferase family protein [Nanoarchaeota archaeon]|nr:CDP-alcohol phosphatidyltransferase family protein [Nanoarchaeota archaeon]
MKQTKKVIKRVNKKQEENIWNIPNTLTFLRVLLTFATIYAIFIGYNIKVIVIFFVVAALTDFFDGQIARRFNRKTEFGSKFDPIADRFLMLGVFFAFVVNLAINDMLSDDHMLQVLMLISREIIALPFVAVAFAYRKEIPPVRWIGKVTTFAQGVAFPAVMLNIYYGELFSFSLYLALLTGVLGVLSAFTFITDVIRAESK